MWRSIFLHEFIDHKISNFKAVPGRATQESLALTPNPTAVPGTNSVEITLGKGFEYMLERPLQQVIGFSCHVRLSYPIPIGFVNTFPIMSLGNDTFFNLSTTLLLPDLNGTMASARIFISQAAASVTFDPIKLPAHTFTDLRFDWHTSGQARLSVDGRLAGYRNSLAPGASLRFDRVAFGMPGMSSFGLPTRYLIARVFVRVLVQSDPPALFSRLLPAVESTRLSSPFSVAPDEMARCRGLMMRNLLNLLVRLRSFMATIHQTLSQPWSQENGPVEGPFRPEARQAHELAVAAAVALGKMLRTGDFSAPDSFLEPFTEFLRILRAAQPGQFDALVAEVGAANVVPDACRELIETSLEKSRQALEPVIVLLSVASERVRAIAGGN